MLQLIATIQPVKKRITGESTTKHYIFDSKGVGTIIVNGKNHNVETIQKDGTTFVKAKDIIKALGLRQSAAPMHKPKGVMNDRPHKKRAYETVDPSEE